MSAYELFHNLAEIADVPTLLFLVDETRVFVVVGPVGLSEDRVL